MNTVNVKNWAKINLTIDVLRKREDGYHEVAMVMQSISLFDEVELTIQDSGIILNCNHPEVPLDETNLAYKAVELYQKKTGFPQGVNVNIKKNIPVAAGLAGGSGNAAAVLLGLNSLAPNPIDTNTLMEWGGMLGSDLPFCIYGHTALAIGRGEIIQPLPTCPELWMVIIKPEFGVSTASVYKHLEFVKIEYRPDNIKMIQALENKDSNIIKSNCLNVLEYATFNLHPEVEQIKAQLIKEGAEYAMMSGSGPTVIGFCKNENHADELINRLDKKYPIVRKVRTVTPDEVNGRIGRK